MHNTLIYNSKNPGIQGIIKFIKNLINLFIKYLKFYVSSSLDIINFIFKFHRGRRQFLFLFFIFCVSFTSMQVNIFSVVAGF